MADEKQQPILDENQIIAERRAKLAELRKHGNAFPNDFDRKDLAADLHAAHGAKSNEELEAEAVHVAVAGRMLLKRVMGKASFASIQDLSGKNMDGRIQLYITNDHAGVAVHEAVSYTHLRAHETRHDLVCRLLLEKKKK